MLCVSDLVFRKVYRSSLAVGLIGAKQSKSLATVTGPLWQPEDSVRNGREGVRQRRHSERGCMRDCVHMCVWYFGWPAEPIFGLMCIKLQTQKQNRARADAKRDMHGIRADPYGYTCRHRLRYVQI